MGITPQFLDQLKNRLQLSDVIGSRIKVMRAGREYKACCPFHQEKTPSFTINDDKQFYHCFGCGAHGDAIGFVMQHDNLSFIEAVEVLASKAGMQVPKSSPQEIEKAKKQKSLYGLMDFATAWYQNQLFLPENNHIQAYLSDRGLTTETLQIFRIGFAPFEQSQLKDSLLAEGYKMEDIISCGVFRTSQKNKEPYAFLRERIVFPVSDRRGRIVAFGGRILPDHLAMPSTGSFKPPKYLNSSETPLFSKGRMLYGEAHARQAASKGEMPLVVEGYTDAIACHQAGFKTAVAPLGTALTEDQLVGLWQMIPGKDKNPILCFDGDGAGLKAAERACERALPLIQANQSVYFAFLPQGEDPDSLIKNEGVAAFKERLKNAIPLVEFLWMQATAGRKFDTPEDRAGLEESLQNQIAKISHRPLQHYYKQIIREKIQTIFGYQSSRKKHRQSSPSKNNGLLKPQKPRSTVDSLRERILLSVLVNHPDIWPSLEDQMEKCSFTDPRLDQLRQFICARMSHDQHLTRDQIIDELKNNGFQTELELILNENIYIHAGFARPERDSQEAREGWNDIWALIYGQNAQQELKKAGQYFASSLSLEQEDHFIKMLREHQSDKQKAS